MDDLRAELRELKRRIALLEDRLAEPAVANLEISVGRRTALLATVTAAFGAFSAAVAPSRAIADTGSPLLLGNGGNTSSSTTEWLVEMPVARGAGWGFSIIDGFGGAGPTINSTFLSLTSGTFEYAVAGIDTANTQTTESVTKGGVYGYSNVNAGVVGWSPGVATGAMGVFAYGSKLGLKATADDTSLKNVAIWANGGVDSTALAVDGKLRIGQSGKIRILGGHSKATVSWAGADASAMGFAMVQSAVAGYFVTHVVLLVESGFHPVTTMNIELNEAAPPGDLHVAWLVVYSMGTTLT